MEGNSYCLKTSREALRELKNVIQGAWTIRMAFSVSAAGPDRRSDDESVSGVGGVRFFSCRDLMILLGRFVLVITERRPGCSFSIVSVSGLPSGGPAQASSRATYSPQQYCMPRSE